MIPSSAGRSGQADLATLLNQALRFHHAGQLDNAAALYRQVLTLSKNQFDTLHMLGVLEGQRGNLAEGVRLISKAIKINPKSADAFLNLGRIQGELEEFHDAEKNLRKALALGPENALAYCNLSTVLDRMKRPADALIAADSALAISPDDPRSKFNRANALYSLGRFDEAEAILREIVAAEPKNAQAWLRLAKAQAKLNNSNLAITSFETAAQLAPSMQGLGFAFGEMLRGLMRYDEALKAYAQELSVQPDSSHTWFSRGMALFALKRYRESIASYDTALRLDPTLIASIGARLMSKASVYDWSGFEAEMTALLKLIEKKRQAIEPFAVLRIGKNAEQQLSFTRAYVKLLFSNIAFPHQPDRSVKNERIKIAYVSSDFGSHPVAQLLVGVLENHDRSKFEIVLVSTTEHDGDLRRRIEKSAEHFFEATELGDAAVAQKLRNLNVQIAVDLNGYSRGARPSIFAQRSAPIQIGFLGYPGTSGTDFIDYIVADRVVIPDEHQRFYSENVVWMPNSFMPTDSKREIALVPTRENAGLPKQSFVFCCFNDPYKITPPLFDIWMRLLKQVEGSVLWLRKATDDGIENLKREAEKRGVSPDRLIFATSVESNAAHLARYSLADLFLDTLPYNAHATANEALWAGLPVLTCLGQTFAGRVAASQLQAVGLPELVTNTWVEYEALALKLAQDPAALRAIRSKLASRAATPLFDTAQYTRDLEAAYTTMWKRHESGQPPASFNVSA